MCFFDDVGSIVQVASQKHFKICLITKQMGMVWVNIVIFLNPYPDEKLSAKLRVHFGHFRIKD